MLLSKNRLTSEADIKKVFSKSKKLYFDDLIFYVHRVFDGSELKNFPKVSFVIAAKSVKNATKRNKIRRILSEALRGYLKKDVNLLKEKYMIVQVKSDKILTLNKIELSDFLENNYKVAIDQADKLV